MARATALEKPNRGWKATILRTGVREHPNVKAKELAVILSEEAKKSGFDVTFKPQEIYAARSAKKPTGKRRGRRPGTARATGRTTSAGRTRAIRGPSNPTIGEAIDHLQIAIRELGTAGVRKIMDLLG